MTHTAGLGRMIVEGVRAAWHSESGAREGVRTALREHPGRAEGRVADWAIDRVAEHLRRHSRRRLRLGAVDACEVTADERHLMSLLESVGRGADEAARLKAEWLVRGSQAGVLIERLQPLADIAMRHGVAAADAERAAEALMSSASNV